MRILDQIYGEFELPEFVGALAQSDLCARSRQLTQDSLPNYLLLRGPIPSRFEHGMGVAHLADLVVTSNPELEKYRKELITAALLHDAGNPPCSHLFEDLLQAHNGHRGESHLAELLAGSGTEQVLKHYGIDAALVVRLVTGREKPLSDVLSGTMDIDNMDNTARHAHHGGEQFYHNPQDIARSFVYTKEGWCLAVGSENKIAQWRKTRKQVYGWLNSDGHTLGSTMIYRAAELAFTAGKLPQDFFKLTDTQAIDFLKDCDEVGASYLTQATINWQWYNLLHSATFTKQPPKRLTNGSSLLLQ